MDSPFAVLGNICIDDLVFEDGTTLWGVPGGNAVYAGLGIAVWGDRPVVVAPVGPEYPTQLLGDRVDLSHCRPLDRTLRDWGLYEEGGTRTFVFRSKTRNWREFSPTLADLESLIADHAHIAPMPTQLQIDFAQALRQGGVKLISVDVDDHELGPVTVREESEWRAFLANVDLFLPSRQDVETLLPGKSPSDALRMLRKMAPDTRVIAVKQGADGVIVHAAGDRHFYSLPSIAETVVDATGAGDAFSGGAIAGYAATGSALDAALWGSVSASFALASSGPAALVEATHEEALSRLARLRPLAKTYEL
ncbi:MAG: carbohydrate kinase family protein [Roseiarcus sp.]|jgi:sugar/nucleoside kinase (ribokinase family)